MIVTLLQLLVLINAINAQFHLKKSNLAQICNCNIHSATIYLNSKVIVSIDGKTFQGLSNLQRLELEYNQLSLIDALSILQDLNLGYNQLSSIDANTFQGL